MPRGPIGTQLGPLSANDSGGVTVKGVQRKNDPATCGRPNSGCSPDVFVNGRAMARLGVDSVGGRISGPGADHVYANGHLISIMDDAVLPQGTGKHRSPRVSPQPSPDVLAGKFVASRYRDPYEGEILVASEGPLLVAEASFHTSYLAGLCRRLAAFAKAWTSVPFTSFNVYDAVMTITGVTVKRVCGDDANDTTRGAAAALSSLPFLAKAALVSFERLIAIVATGAGASPEVALAIGSSSR